MTAEFIVNHLWQSSCFVLLAGLLAVALRKSPSKVRYWVWLSASLKFLLPLALLMSLGSMVPRPAQRVSWATDTVPFIPNAIVQIAEPFTPTSYSEVPAHAPTHWLPVVIGIVWAFGFLAIASVRCRSWFRVRAALQAATPIELPIPISALIAPSATEPGIVGFHRPVLVLPPRLLEHLNSRQLDAVLAHEMCHVRRHDNFFAAIHMVVEAIFWFHPLVWWIGSRMVEERELACDEEVLRMGCDPGDYVGGILQVCRYYNESPLPCVAGVTGADVKKRLRAILAGSVVREWNVGKKVALAVLGLATLTVPFVVGVLNAPAIHAQNGPAATFAAASAPAFEVASVKAHELPPGLFGFVTLRGSAIQISGNRVMTRGTLTGLLLAAYDLRPFQLSGTPTLPDNAGGDQLYDIEARTPGEGVPTMSQVRQMLGTLLADRFQLKFHRETKELPAYDLVTGNNTPKFKQSPADAETKTDVLLTSSQLMRFKYTNVAIPELVIRIASQFDRPLFDKTGLAGGYDFTLEYTPRRPDIANSSVAEAAAFVSDGGMPIIAAIQQQLGLKVVQAKERVEILVIDHVARPSEN